MRAFLRDHLVVLAIATAAVGFVVEHAAGFGFWNDFHDEAYTSYRALQQGDITTYLTELPVYGGFLTVFGAPFALLAGALGGEDELALGLTSIPGAVALVALLTFLTGHLRRAGAPVLALAVALGAPLPLVLLTLKFGHPEDLLAATASVGAVLAALSGRRRTAILLLAAAIVSKQWAVLALAPAMLAAPDRQWRLGFVAVAMAGAVLVPLALLAPDGQHSLVSTSHLFHAHQIWWPLGVAPPAGMELARGATTVAPAWLGAIIHPLIVILAAPLAYAWWRRGGARRRPEDALLLLALLFLERCMLDPWNIHYYHLPFALSLLAWETRRGPGVPVLTLSAVAAVWFSFVTYKVHYGYGPYLAYMAWSLPLAGVLGWTLYRSPLRSENPWLAGPTSAARRSSRSTSTT